MEHFLSSGNEVLDNLCMGIESDVITTIYGPAGSGKSNFCIMMAADVISRGKKVLYIDTDGSFSPERLKQIAEGKGLDYKEMLDSMLFYKPVTFQEQKGVFDKLKSIMTDTLGLVIVDSIAMLYRLEFGKSSDEIYGINRELGRQLSFLSEISRKKRIPILITNQVYSSFDEKDKINMVGGDILRYGSKCLIEIKPYKTVKKARLVRHRSLPQDKEVLFRITQQGVELVDNDASSADHVGDTQKE
ncbi:MAG: DNA repair and recombination protein RadB [Candidatus Woesearchaeota archaeon]